MAKELLKISEFAELSGISRKLLIFYDNNGILHPQKVDKENEYRYYSYRQIDTASVIVSLREAGVPLDTIREYLLKKSPKNLIALLSEQECILDRQIQKLCQIKDMVQSKIEQTGKGLSAKAGSIFTESQSAENLFLGKSLPDNYVLGDGWAYLPDFYAACKAQNIQPGFTVGTMVLHKNLTQGLWNKPNYYFCRLPNGQYQPFFTKPAGNYLLGTDYADYGQVGRLYKKMLRYIKNNQLYICGNAYEEYLVDEIAEGNPERYLLQIAIQIKPG